MILSKKMLCINFSGEDYFNPGHFTEIDQRRH
jgi:hypothetical protein